MITGMGISPTYGQAEVFKTNIFKQRGLMNSMIGICPQEDLLVFNMTVMENLYYFLGIKMLSVAEIEEYADRMLKTLDLDKQRDQKV